MTIFYVDPVNGSDAAAGTSWGTAWKTFVSGPTAVRIAPGDEIRVAKSPDPEDVGTATWTTRKIGNSITFDTAPTKQIDTMKSGWVTMGAGSTVTNAQATAYMMWGITAGTGAALQVTTSAAANMAYKPLGSTQDFSAHQQVSFWFRSSSAFDCTGAQNMFIRLCSDTVGATPVNTLTMPKWSYATNTWYPIVIDSGGALGSNIQSVSITTTNNTTQTFYFDEMFASPAAGLTLQSLIEDNDDTWYAIRTIRGADVWLMSTYAASTAAGATPTVSLLDTAWVGTTANFMTRKRETMKTYTASISPTSGTWCQTNEAGTWTSSVKLLDQYRFGFNTATDTQDGYTYIDNLIQSATCLSNGSNSAWRFENLVAVRFATGITISTIGETDYLGAIACGSTSLSISSMNTSATWLTSSKTINIASLTGNNSGGTISTNASSFTNAGITINFTTNLWGNTAPWTISSIHNSIINYKNVLTSGSVSSNGAIYCGGNSNVHNVRNIEVPISTAYPTTPNASAYTIQVSGSVNEIINVDTIFGGAGINLTTAMNTTFNIGAFSGSAISLIGSSASTSYDNIVLRCLSNNSGASGAAKWASSFGGHNSKIYIHDFNGAGTALVLSSTGQQGGGTPPFGVFELQTGDVHTGGSKAWKYTTTTTAEKYYGVTHTLKLASAAVVANKLVTVTCYVKKSASTQVAGIRVPAIFLPGYTSNIVSNFSSTAGTWEQLTITFTPTADCVFDLEGYINYDEATTNTEVVWDDLSITQAP